MWGKFALSYITPNFVFFCAKMVPYHFKMMQKKLEGADSIINLAISQSPRGDPPPLAPHAPKSAKPLRASILDFFEIVKAYPT